MLRGALGVFRIKGMQLRSVFHHNDLAAIPIAAKDFGRRFAYGPHLIAALIEFHNEFHAEVRERFTAGCLIKSS